MTWTKISDDFADDCWTLTDAAFRLHLEGLAWSARKLLDLRIPKDDLPRASRRPEAVTELVAHGWWTDDGDAYVIRHHAVYQRTRDQVLAQQEANIANGRKGGRPPTVPREQAADLTPETQSVSESLSESPSESPSERDGTGQDSFGQANHNESDVRTRVREPSPGLELTPYLRKWAASRGWPDDGSLDQTLIDWGPLTEAQWCRRLRETTEPAYQWESA